MVDYDVGTIIRHHRLLKGMRQKDLAALVKASPRTVGRWERGEREPFKIIHWILLAREIPEVEKFMPFQIWVMPDEVREVLLKVASVDWGSDS